MRQDTEERNGCFSLGILSIGSSTLGSILAAIIFSYLHQPIAVPPSLWEATARDILSTGLVVIFGAPIAIATGLFVGLPMLAIFGKLVARRPISSTIIFGFVGFLGGLTIQRAWNGDGLQNAELIFGACVGGMHAVVYSRAQGARWRTVFAAVLASAAILPATIYASDDLENLLDSRREYEVRCTDRYNSKAFVADRAAFERLGDPVRSTGKWYNQRRWRSLYEREDRLPLDNTRVLIGHDYAYVPSGFSGWITGGRRIARHCLSEREETAVNPLRQYGFGVRPRLRDLVD
jgi:hypothetical protein